MSPFFFPFVFLRGEKQKNKDEETKPPSPLSFSILSLSNFSLHQKTRQRRLQSLRPSVDLRSHHDPGAKALFLGPGPALGNAGGLLHERPASRGRGRQRRRRCGRRRHRPPPVDRGAPRVEARGRAVLRQAARRGRRGRADPRGGQGAPHHEAAAQGQKRHAAAAQVGAAHPGRQGPRVRRRAPVQPDPPAADVPGARRPGAPRPRQGRRPRPEEARRARPPLRAQGPRGRRAAADRRGLLCADRREGDRGEPGQGGGAGDDDRGDEAGEFVFCF